MSPIALFYLLLASPVLNTNWLHHHESPLTTPASWNTFDVESLLRHDLPYSSIYESSIFSPVTRRSSLLRELSGRHFESSTMSPAFRGLESPIRVERMIRRIAEVNPLIVSELIRSCPETRYAVEKLIRRSAEEKIVRRVVKKLIKNTILSTRRSSILRELSPITPFNTFSELPFYGKNVNFCNMCENMCMTPSTPSTWGMCSVCNEICPMNSWTPVSPLNKVVRRLVKKSLYNKVNALPFGKNVEFCNVCENICESSTPYTKTWGMCSICHEVCPSTWTPVSPFSPVSPLSVSPLNKERIVRKLVKAIVLTKKHSTKKHFCKVADRVCESSTYEKVLSKKVAKVCKVAELICEKVVYPTSYEHESIFAGKLLKKLVKESLRMESFSPVFGRRFF